MKITDDVYLVGSGEYGISDDYDCNVYAVKGKEEIVLIDSGAGRNTSKILEVMEGDGLDISKISTVLLTHSHADHACGSKFFYHELGCDIYISEEEKALLEIDDEDLSGLKIAKRSGLYDENYRFIPFLNSKIAGDKIVTKEFEIKCISFKGHSRQSICYLFDLQSGLCMFSGDVVFSGGVISVLNCGDSSLKDYRENIHKFEKLNIDCLFPGHMTFCLKNSQKHLDKAIENLSEIYLPKVQCVK